MSSAFLPNIDFNPRSREGSDALDAACRQLLDDFNPRSREGSDTGEGVMQVECMAISIHAPARGATFDDGSVIFKYYDFNPRSREGSDGSLQSAEHDGKDFNPRSREGSDALQMMRTTILQGFQSTLPRGERRSASGSSWKHRNFNPRSREGSD